MFNKLFFFYMNKLNQCQKDLESGSLMDEVDCKILYVMM